MFRRVAIAGLGLTGSSIGLALHKAKAADQVVGYDSNKQVAQHARKSGAIDQVYTSFAEAIRGAELIILAMPIHSFRSCFQDIATHGSPGTVITDVASTKTQVISWAEEYLPASMFFVGGHPIPDKDLYGDQPFSTDLFAHCIYCLTPTKRTSTTALDKVMQLIKVLGARVRFLEPAEHDGLVAGVNHLPFVLSTIFMHTVAESASWADAAIVADKSSHDMTRLTMNEPESYRDICLTNSEALARWISDYMDRLSAFRDQLISHDGNLIDVFDKAQTFHKNWQSTQESDK